MEPLSRRARLDPNVFQNYISDAPWSDVDVQRTNIRKLHSEKLASANALIVVDDTGFPKKGDLSPGVARQYSGTMAKIDNCQLAVAAFYIVPGKARHKDCLRWPLGGRLYLPKHWIEDSTRRARAKIPREVVFKTKWELALDIIDQALAEKVPHRCIAADGWYGDVKEFRAALRARKEPYIMRIGVTQFTAIPEDTPVGLRYHGGSPPKHLHYPKDVRAISPKAWAAALSATAWKRVRWSEGTKGTLEGTFARVRVRVAFRYSKKDNRASEEVGWLLLEQEGERLKAFFAWGLDACTLKELVRLAHARPLIERAFQEMKEELGLDHFEGRSWSGFHHHMTMVFLAYSYLQWIRATGQAGEELPSLAEVRWQVVQRALRGQLIGEGYQEREAKAIVEMAAPYLEGA